MNKLTKQQQIDILQEAARLTGLGEHVQTCGDTAAEKVMRMFGGEKSTPRKTSYLYCDSVDACFYIQNDLSCVTFTARWTSRSKDLESRRIENAVSYIKDMLYNMERLVQKAKEEAHDGD